MIIVVAKHWIKQENISDYIRLMKPLITETNLNHEGCLRYELLQDLESPNVLTMLEEWEDQAALKKHMAAPLFKEIVPQTAKYLEKPVELNQYQKVD